MQYFMNHIENLLIDWTRKMLAMNGEDKQTDVLEKLLNEGETLETPYPEDLFKFFN